MKPFILRIKLMFRMSSESKVRMTIRKLGKQADTSLSVDGCEKYRKDSSLFVCLPPVSG